MTTDVRRKVSAWLAVASVLVAGFLAATDAAAAVAAPAPCGGVPQITDVSGDGHHSSSDVLAAWLSEPAVGALQATIQVKSGSWLPEHDDAVINGSGFAFLFTAGAETHYVRATAPPANGGVLLYDYGTWTLAGGFQRAGDTTGSIVPGPSGTVTIDVPAATGTAIGTRLTNLFVLTYDGIGVDGPTWVDRAPGGTVPTEDSTFGADFLVGACSSPPPAGAASVQLSAGTVPVGGGAVAVSGRVLPPRAGVAVSLARVARRSLVSRFTTGADGTFSGFIPVREATVLRAVVEGVQSQSLSLRVRSRISVRAHRVRGTWAFTGDVAPALPGRLLLLRVGGFTPVKRGRIVTGHRYTMRVRDLARGRYQMVWLPTGGRADRAVSRTIRVRK
jgi:hypothetical protein